MPNRPQIRCPCCGSIFPVESLQRLRLRRNSYGIDIFGCPECKEQIKIDPYEYLAAREMMERNELPADAAIGAYREAELVGPEKAGRKESNWFSRLFR
jgi:ssDNA-binding Zn-finger/Zn-ribbon topoisomerase 1